MQIQKTATDFMFDNVNLSSFGMMICTFNNSSLEEIQIGNKITYNTVKPPMNDKNFFIGATYEEPITTSFQICKNPCSTNYENKGLSANEIDALLSWLIRKDGYHKFKLYQTGYEDIYFNAYFNDVQAVRIGGEVYGLTLTVTTDSPYGYSEAVSIDLDMKVGENYNIVNMSSEIGYTVPSLVLIECIYSGDLLLTNATAKKSTQIRNCSSSEVITMDCIHKIISTSNGIHVDKLCDDFNYNYFKLVRTRDNAVNKIYSSLQCKLHLEYNPIRKVGIV